MLVSQPHRQFHAGNPAPCLYQVGEPLSAFSSQVPKPMSLHHKTPWLILLNQIQFTGQGIITWLVTCLLCVCSAIHCKPSVCLFHQHMYPDEVRCSCLPIEPSWPSPLLCFPEVCFAGHTRDGSKQVMQHVLSSCNSLDQEQVVTCHYQHQLETWWGW